MWRINKTTIVTTWFLFFLSAWNLRESVAFVPSQHQHQPTTPQQQRRRRQASLDGNVRRLSLRKNHPVHIRHVSLTDNNDKPETTKEPQEQQQQQLLPVHDPSPPPSPQLSSSTSSSVEWVGESKHVELLGLITWMTTLSVFILINNFVGPWPNDVMRAVPERVWFFGHMMGGMLFGGGVILTTAIEWLVCQNKNTAVMQFWFDKVPLLDMALVLPGLTLSMISGTGLSIVRYGGLALAPVHIQYAFWALVTFAAWWALTDLTTQGSALNAVLDLSPEHAPNALSNDADGHDENQDQHLPNIKVASVPNQVTDRLVSNLVSCFLVVVMYAIMVLKPGTLHYW